MTSFYEKSQQHVALETIQNQDKAKYKKLEDIAYKLLLKGREGASAAVMESYIEPMLVDEIRRLFNIKIELTVIVNSYDLAIRYSPPTMVSTLTPTDARKQLLRMLGDKTIVKGHSTQLMEAHKKAARPVTADLKNGTLRCKYGDVEATLILGTEVLRNPKMTQGKFTAVLLHEIGHVMNSIIYSTSYDNQLHNINNAAMALRGLKRDKVKYKMIGELRANKVLTTKQAKELQEDPDGSRLPADLTSIVYGNIHNSMLGLPQSNQESEKLADTFSVRCGYGLELMALSREFRELLAPKKSVIELVFGLILSLFIHFLNVALWAFLFTAAGFSLVVAVSFSIIVTIIANTRSAHTQELYAVHPQGDTRTNNIKRDVIGRAKDTDFKHKKELDRYLKDVAELERVGEGMGITYSFFDTFMFERTRRQHADIATLLNNPLYLDLLKVKLLTMK